MDTHPIGLNRAVPCVGSPDGTMFACGAEGEISLVTIANAQVMSPEAAPEVVTVHVTVCPAHVREVRAWLSRMTPEPIEAWSTSVLLENWAIFTESMEDTPIWTFQKAG